VVSVAQHHRAKAIDGCRQVRHVARAQPPMDLTLLVYAEQPALKYRWFTQPALQ
jgi:hypothetical protein